MASDALKTHILYPPNSTTKAADRCYKTHYSTTRNFSFTQSFLSFFSLTFSKQITHHATLSQDSRIPPPKLHNLFLKLKADYHPLQTPCVVFTHKNYSMILSFFPFFFRLLQTPNKAILIYLHDTMAPTPYPRRTAPFNFRTKRTAQTEFFYLER